jgi:hypothetical protein
LARRVQDHGRNCVKLKVGHSPVIHLKVRSGSARHLASDC